jgi:cation-transporting ATPase E
MGGMARSSDSLRGLSAAEVRERSAAGLSNRMPTGSSRSLWHILRGNLFTLFNGVVGASFLILLVLGQWQDALFGFALIGNVLIGVVQEYRAKRTLDALAVLHAPRARVLRDGVQSEVPLAALVLDDILVLRIGDQVAADAVILAEHGIELDESLLTGEVDPVFKTVGDEVLSGSAVVAGHGMAQVCRVGAASFANQLTAEAKLFSLVNSELRNSINRILRVISWALIPLVGLVVNGQMQALGGWAVAIENGSWQVAIVRSVASTIGLIPLGLVLITSIAFALAAVTLSRQQVLIQELPAVEGLARVDIVCLDKTGTLTEGDIVFDAVHEVHSVRELADSDAARWAPQTGWRRVLGWCAADENANATARCLEAAFPAGLAGEGELLPVSSVPFSSALKWSAVTFGPAAPDVAGTWVLGAPELVLSPGQSAGTPQSSVTRETLARAAALAATGLRTLVLAHSPSASEDVTGMLAPGTLAPGMLATGKLPVGPEPVELRPVELSPVVLVTFRERIRPDAQRTLAYFRAQGVGLRILSGDNPRTVAAVAREAGMEFAGDGFDATLLPADAAELASLLERETVFGRVTPTQKRDIVRALQRQGHVVAMTGDGVNDALALKQADIGIAMGSGSDVTKAVSRLVLLDGEFAHLPGVVAEGRRVIANIERVSKLFLSKTFYAFLLAIAFAALLWEFPFLPRQLSAIDGLTIGIPSFVLALEPNARRYLPGFLRRSLAFSMPVGLIIGTAVVALNVYLVRGPGSGSGAGLSQSAVQTASFITLGLAGLWVLVVLARPLNRWRFLLVVVMYAGLAGCVLMPVARDFFNLLVPDGPLLAASLVAAAVACAGVEIAARLLGRRLA